MTEINLLPWREKLKEEKRRQFFIFMGLTASLAVFCMIIIHGLYAAKINIQREKVSMLKQQIKMLDDKIVLVSDLKKQKMMLVNKMKMIDELQKSRPIIIHVFDEIVKVLPQGIYLTSIERKGEKFILTGLAESNTNVSVLMRNMSDSSYFKDPQLSEIKQDNEQVEQSNFKLEVMQKTTIEKRQK